MPFKSEKQRRYLFANEPEVAKKFAKDYNMGGVASMFRKRLADGDDPFYDAWKKVYETNPDAASMNEKHDEYLEKYTLEMSTQTSEAPTEDVEQTADPMLNLFSETDALNNDQALTTLFAKEEPQGIMAAANGGFAMQGGVRNYLGKTDTVSDVPVKWKSSPDHPETELAYITKAEKDLLLKKDLHNSLEGTPNKGPGELISLNGWGDASDGFGGSGETAGPGDTGGEGGDSPQDNSTSQTSNNTTSNNDEGSDQGHSRFDVGSGYYGEEVTTSSDDGGDTYKDPIIDMVGKKVVVDPTTGGNIVVDKNSVLMKERKLKMSKGKRPAAWVSPTEKEYFDNLDDYIDSKTGFFSKYNAEKFLVNQIKSKIPIIGPFLPTIYPSKNINFKSTSKYEVPGSDLGFYDPDEYPEFWGKGPDDNEPDGDAYPVIPGVIDDTNEEFIDFSLMSALDKIRANQARRKGLVEDDIIQDNETIVDNEIMTANKGGLAGLFKVKTQ